MKADKTTVLELELPAAGPERSALEDLFAAQRWFSPGNSIPAMTPGLLPANVGKLSGFTESGVPLVDFSGNPDKQPLSARHTCAVSPSDLGRDAVLLFENNDLRSPIIIGFLQAVVPADENGSGAEPVNATVDEEQITLTARNQIILRCGEASITLTRAGKIIIRGAYLLSRSSGVNRIKGGSVQIN